MSERSRQTETEATKVILLTAIKKNGSIIVSDQWLTKRVYQYSSTANYKLAYPKGYK